MHSPRPVHLQALLALPVLSVLPVACHRLARSRHGACRRRQCRLTATLRHQCLHAVSYRHQCPRSATRHRPCPRAGLFLPCRRHPIPRVILKAIPKVIPRARSCTVISPSHSHRDISHKVNRRVRRMATTPRVTTATAMAAAASLPRRPHHSNNSRHRRRHRWAASLTTTRRQDQDRTISRSMVGRCRRIPQCTIPQPRDAAN